MPKADSYLKCLERIITTIVKKISHHNTEDGEIEYFSFINKRIANKRHTLKYTKIPKDESYERLQTAP